MNSKKNSIAQFCCDYLPLLVFFGIYKFSNSANPLIEATIYLIITTVFALIISYVLIKKIPFLPLFSAIILGFFGGLTVLFQDELFIKIKPTIINLIFASILIFGYIIKKPFLSYILGEKLKMSEQAWLSLSLRWGIFFLFLAILNEIIWRNFSTDFWVQFKVFGMMPISLIFTFSQLPFMMRNVKEFEKTAKE